MSKKVRGKSQRIKKTEYAPETRLIWGKSFTPKWDYSHHVVPPISSSSTFRLSTTKRGAKGFIEFAHHAEDFTVKSKAPIYIYDRLGEPNKDLLEENLAAAERGDCAVTFATGMAAVSAVCGILLGSGSEIIAHKMLYGCTYSLFKNWLPRYHIKVTWIDFNDHKALDAAISPQTRLLYFETPVNPTMELIDIRKVVELARRHNLHRSKAHHIFTAVDNTFATPFCQRPLMYFIPKGRTPQERHRKANRLVNYIADNSYTMTLAVSLGNIRTLIEHPGSMTHSSIPPEEQLKRGIDPGGIRLSIGLEKAEDIIHDLGQALGKM
jgi:cystathionine beta-lyase/cystathionine gamma-synthase